MDDYIGSIKLFAGNVNAIPYGWMLCDGQSLNINEYGPLFGVISYKYGGSGNTFMLPNFQGRSILGAGTSAAGTVYTVGQTGGNESVTVEMANMPAHKHVVTGTVTMMGSADPGNQSNPQNAFYAAYPGQEVYNTDTDESGSMGVWMNLDVESQSTGGGQPYDNMQPYIGLHHIICHQGYFPSPDAEPEDLLTGIILPFAGNVIPQGWMLCDGSTYESGQYRELYSVIGTTFGGTGTQFKVPNLCGRVAVGVANGETAGETAGSENVLLNLGNIMNHSHSVNSGLQMACNMLPGDTQDPDGTFPAPYGNLYSAQANVEMGNFDYDPLCLVAGASTLAPLKTQSPYIAMQYVICYEGDYPFRPNE